MSLRMCPTGTTPQGHGASAKIPGFRQVFDVLDKDGDGKISAHDLQTFYNDFSNGITSEEDIGSMISVADLNKNGLVEFEEFEQVLGCKQSSPVNKKLMEDVFKVMDKDGDGKVGYDDLKSYMSWARFGSSDEDIRAMIELGGGDERGVSYEGLVKILALDCT